MKNHSEFWPAVFIHRFLVLNPNIKRKLEGGFWQNEKTNKKVETTVCETVLALNCPHNYEAYLLCSWKASVNFTYSISQVLNAGKNSFASVLGCIFHILQETEWKSNCVRQLKMNLLCSLQNKIIDARVAQENSISSPDFFCLVLFWALINLVKFLVNLMEN